MQDLVLDLLEHPLVLRGLEHELRLLLLELGALLGDHDAEHLVLEALGRDHEVEQRHLDRDLGQVVRVAQLGRDVELEVLVVLDDRVAELDRERLVRLLPRAYLPSHLLELTLERVPVGRRVTQYSNEFLQLLRPLASLGVPFVALRRDVGLLLEEQVQPRVRLRRVGCGRRLKLCNLAGERVLLEAQGALRFFALDKRCARLLAQAHRLVLCLAQVQPREHGASKEAAKHPEYHEPDQPDGQPPRRSERRVALPYRGPQ